MEADGAAGAGAAAVPMMMGMVAETAAPVAAIPAAFVVQPAVVAMVRCSWGFRLHFWWWWSEVGGLDGW